MKRPSWFQILICFSLFMVFFCLTFPLQNLRNFVFKKIYDTSGVVITADSLSPNFFGWPGVTLKNPSVSIPTVNGDVNLTSQDLVARFRLAGFIPPIPAISFALYGLKGGGNVYARVAHSGETYRIVAEASKANLAQINIPGFPEPIPGILDMDGDFSVDTKDLSRSIGSLDLDIQKTLIPALNLQGIILPVLNFGDIKIKLTIRNGTVEILNFKMGSKGSDISGSLSGEMRLGQSIYSSQLNITLKLALSPGYVANPQGATLVSLLESYKDSKGEYGLRWNATIQDMMTNVAAALPQKVSN